VGRSYHAIHAGLQRRKGARGARLIDHTGRRGALSMPSIVLPVH
jgi:hypothetical protein